MSLAYIRSYYKVPAERGRRIRSHDGRHGTIVGTTSGTHYLEIHFDGDKHPKGPFHPTDGMTYLDEVRPPPKLTRSQERYRRYREVADVYGSFKHFLKCEKANRHHASLRALS